MKKSMIAAMSVLLLTASCGDAEAEEGLVPRLERLAGRGNAEAIYYLGMGYQTGTDLPKDPAKALDAFRRQASVAPYRANRTLRRFTRNAETCPRPMPGSGSRLPRAGRAG